MRRSFIMHHCFAVVWRRSLELNPCRIKFIKNQGVALWQRRRRRVRRRNRRAREPRLELDSTSGRTGVRPLSSLLQKKQRGCSALFRYFPDAPVSLYAQIKVLLREQSAALRW